MKIEELRIGDWVLHNSEPFKIAELNLTMCSVTDRDNELYDLVDYECLSPIPLTGEILEKNGWRKHKIATSRWLYSYKRSDYPRLNIEKEGFSFHCMDKDIKINAVHQLQHILWALGINDDLKI